MIRVAVCDDDVKMTGLIENLLCYLGKKQFIKFETEVFFDGQELNEIIKHGVRFDIILLDIEMKKENGLIVAKKIREVDNDVTLIFITSYECYVREAFEVQAFQFIVKPIDEKIFEKHLLSAYGRIIKNDVYFEFKYNKIYQKILLKNIMYFESQKRVVYLVLKEKRIKIYAKLNDIEKELLNSKFTFLRIHQSILVNYRYINGLSYERVFLNDGNSLGISENKRKLIRDQYCEIGGCFHE